MSAPTRTASVPSVQLAREESVVTAFAKPALVPAVVPGVAGPAASAVLNGQAVTEFVPSTRDALADHQQPAALATLTVTLPLSREELVAALFFWLDGMDAAELDDDDYARRLVVEAAVNMGMAQLCDSVQTIAADNLGPLDREALDYAHRRVAELFPGVPAGPAAPVGAIPAQRAALHVVRAQGSAVTPGPLAGAQLRRVSAALYFSDYRPGDLNRAGLEWVESCALVGLDGLTEEHVDWVHNAAPAAARMADCRATARTLLAAQ